MRRALAAWVVVKRSQEFGDEGGRHVHFALSVRPGELDELVRTLAERGVDHEGPVEHEGGDRSVYFEDPEGNVVEAWDFFEHGDGGREGVDALR
jgi:catechol-2,3-dioxygenase